MKILIPSLVDINKIAPNRLHHFVEFLSKKHEITVICINDWWRAENIDPDKHYQNFSEVLEKIEIKYLTKKKVSLAKQEFLSKKILDLERSNDYDVVFNYVTLIAGRYAAKKFDLPMIYDLADNIPAMIGLSPQIPRISRPFGKLIGTNLLKKSQNVSEKIIGITMALKDKYTIPNDKFELVPNGVDCRLFRKIDNGFREDIGLENDLVLGYVGVLREWVDLQPVYRVIRNAGNVKLLIVGEEGNLLENKQIVRKLGIEDKVIFAGTVPYNMVPGYISAMDVCLIPFKQNAISEYSLPLKLFEYMACEKPVISTRIKGVVDSTGQRVLYANTSDEYGYHINNLIKNRSSLDNLGKDGRKFAIEKYDWIKIAKDFESIINKVTRNHESS